MGYAEAVLACLLYGGNTVAGRLIAPQVPPFALSFIRGLLGLWVLTPWLLPAMKKVGLEAGDRWRLGVLGIIGIGLPYVTFAWSLRNVPATNAAIIFATFPAVTTALLALIWRVKPGLAQVAGIIIAFSGLVWVITQGSLVKLLTLSFRLEDGLLLLNVICVAGSNIWGQSLMRRYPPLVVAGYSLLFGTLALLPAGLWEIATSPWQLSPGGWLLVIYMGAVISGANMYLNFEAIRRIGSGPMAIFQNLNPVFSVFLAAALLREPLYLYHAVGIVLVLTGVTLSLQEDLNARR